MSLVGRVWRLEVGSQVYEGIDLQATARWPAGQPGTVDLTVYHPGPVLEGQCEARTEVVRVLAGYEDDRGAIEIGSGLPVKDSIEIDRASVDRPMRLQLSSSKAANAAVLSSSWGQVTATELLTWIAGEAGLALDARLGQEVTYTRYSISAGITRAVSDLATDTGSRWLITGATLRVWPAGEVARERADLWSASTGLLSVSGSGDEIRASAFLRPDLRRGDKVRIVDEGYNGDVIVTEATHEIDTFGDAWTTTITARPL